MRALPLVLLASVALADERVIGAGKDSAGSAPFLLNEAGSKRKVTISQHLYAASELGMEADERIIDVAWNKDYLTGTTGQGCAIELWMKNLGADVVDYPAGSTQTLEQATLGATKVFSGASQPLPKEMGFVRLYPVEDTLNFSYSGGSLELTTVVDCRAAVLDGPVLWRADAVTRCGRGSLGSTAAGPSTVLASMPPFTRSRPQLRLRSLKKGKRLRVHLSGGSAITNGAAFAPAPNYLAAATAVPNRYELVNWGQQPVAISSIAIENKVNVSVVQGRTEPTTLLPGERRPISFAVTPNAIGATQWTYRVLSDDPAQPNFSWRVQGTTQATPAPQPWFVWIAPDGTLVPISATAAFILSYGPRLAGVPFGLLLQYSNFGSEAASPVTLTEQAGATNVSTTLAQAPASLGIQEDHLMRSQVRALANGEFATQYTLMTGSQLREVLLAGPAGAPEIEVYEADLFQVLPVPNQGTADLGSLYKAGETQHAVFWIENSGDAELSLPMGAIIEEPIGCAVEILEQTDPSVVPKGMTFFKVALTTSGSPWSFKVRIPNNDEDEAPYVFTVTGTNGKPKLRVEFTAGPGDTLPGTVLSEGYQVQLGHPYLQARDLGGPVIDVVTYTVTNIGAQPLAVSAITASEPRSGSGVVSGRVVVGSTAFTVGPGESMPFDTGLAELLADPINDEMTFEMTIASNDPEQPDFTFKVTVSTYKSPFVPPPNENSKGCSAAPGTLALFALAGLLRGRRRP